MALAYRDVHDPVPHRRTSSLSDQTKKGYKVVVESVLEEKKPLKSHVCYSETAPAGYTFVPVGIPDLTDACKELARKRGLDILIVSTPITHRAHLNAEHISHHIHRIGHHFPNKIVDDVRAAMHNDRAHQAIGTASMSRRLDAQSRRMGLIGSTVTAQQRSQQIAGAIKELFPRIPDEDCSSIVERAFQTGANTVGNAVELPLARRVQLAVVAHIRHVHTDYDVLLKLFKWGRARQIVEEPCLQVITKWRGERDEHDDDLAELEQVFREVIVIDDSDNEDDFEAPSLGHRRRRSLSLEIVSQRTVPEPSSGYVSAPRKKKRRLSPPKYHSPPPLQHVNPHAPDIVHVRPQRGPLPRQILQLDEMTRRAEDLSPQILPQYQGNQLGRLPTTSSYSYPAAHRHTPAHAQDHRRQDLPGDQPMMPQIPEYAPPAGYNVAMAPPRNERVYQSIEGKASGYRYDGQHHERGY